MQTKNESLNELVFDLDCQIGSLNNKLTSLNDVKTLIGNLRVALDNVNESEVQFHFRDYHRTVRIVNELVNYSLGEAINIFESMEKTKEEIFKRVRELEGRTS